jgi:transcriptional regulator with XRE-family HTH domain
MPRRKKADRLSLLIGRRIRQLRSEAGLTMEKLAYESELGSKGHLSNIERGLVHTTVHTLQTLADRLDVLLLDLVTFPERSARERRVDADRLSGGGTRQHRARRRPLQG